MADYTNIIGFTEEMEGGLSSAQTDNAKANPSPCGNGKNGYPYHTNKGVQWISFKTLAPSIGYEPSCANFLKMPKDIWLKIFKRGYWDPMKGDDIRNQAIANIFAKWAFGSGVTGATNSLKEFFKEKRNLDFSGISQMVDYVNGVDAKKQTLSLFNDLMAWRKQFLINIPGDANDKGWFSREDKFYIMNLPYALSSGTKKALVYGSVLILIGAGLAVYGRYR